MARELGESRLSDSTSEIVTAIATAVTAVTAIIFAWQTRRKAQQGGFQANLAALNSIDKELMRLQIDAPAAIASVERTTPTPPGFLLVTDALDNWLEGLFQSGVIESTEHEALLYLLRQATDTNRAIHGSIEAAGDQLERLRQMLLVAQKARHLLEDAGSGWDRCQAGRKAISAARVRLQRKHGRGGANAR